MVEQTPAADAESATVPARPQRQQSSIPSLLFLAFILFMLTSHNGDELLARHQHQDNLQTLGYQLANYTAWLNGTKSNFTLPERDLTVEPLLSYFNVFGPFLDPNYSSYYSNITGFIHGDVKFHNITPSHISRNSSEQPWSDMAENLMVGVNMTNLVDWLGTWNWSASHKVALSVVEKKPLTMTQKENVSQNIALVHGRMEFTDANNGEDFRLDFEGVHFIRNGSIYGLAEPTGRQIDIRRLPSLVPENYRNETALIIAPELSARIIKLRKLIDGGVIDQEMSNNNDKLKSKCPFTFYAQIGSANVSDVLMQELEDEIQKPTGIWTVKPPKLSVDGLLISKDCGILYEVINTEGLRSRTFFRKVITYAGTASFAYFGLLVLLSRQMARTHTPAAVSRVSRWSFLTQAIVDSVSFAAHITFAILAEGRPSLSLIAPAFLACLLFVYEAQFALLIFQVQLPEDVASRQSAGPPPPVQTRDQSGALPPPTPTTSAILTFLRSIWQHLRSDAQSRFWLCLFIFLTVIVRVVLSPSLALAFVAVMYSCFWLPQIFRSARRGRSSSLSKEYLFGTTICRLFFAAYFLACPRNVLDVEPRSWVHMLACFVFLQVLVIVLQQYFGPSFFLPRRYVTVQIYDYHPPMPPADQESPEQSLGDCAICMDAIYIDPSLRRSNSIDGAERDHKGESGGLLNMMQKGVGATARKNYSLAPCHHLFHTECLETWLAIKNICPQCRRPLPPL